MGPLSLRASSSNRRKASRVLAPAPSQMSRGGPMRGLASGGETGRREDDHACRETA